MSIKPLPRDVADQIRSSAIITSLGSVVCGLLQNSLDAGATRLHVSVDLARGDCSVEDNGEGIPPSAFTEAGGLGLLYFTSKYPSQTNIYGRHGIFLASVASLSLCSIASRQRQASSTSVLRIHNSKVLSRHVSATAECLRLSPDHGTQVSIKNLFGSMPVRIRHRALLAEKSPSYLGREWDQLILDIVALLLAWQGPVSLTIIGQKGHQKLNLRRLAVSAGTSSRGFGGYGLLRQSSIASGTELADWISIAASDTNFIISGHVCLISYASRRAQFMSFGILPLSPASGNNVLYDEVNKVFANSAFGAIENDGPKGPDATLIGQHYTRDDMKIQKGIDRWPMFVLEIRASDSRLISTDHGTKVGDAIGSEVPRLSKIIELLKALFYEFLKKHQFRPVRGPRHESSFTTRNVNGRSEESNDHGNKAAAPPVRCEAISMHHIRDKLQAASHPQQGASGRRDTVSSRPESPFSSWSRVKAGQQLRTFKPDASILNRARSATPSRSLNSPNSSITITGAGQLSNPSTTLTTPLYDPDGNLLRKPFDDDPTTDLHDTMPTQNMDDSSLRSDTRKGVDEPIVWHNPLTGTKAVVDPRTGFVKPSIPDNGHRASSGRPEPAVSREWAKDVVARWKNPVFGAVETPIPQLAFDASELQEDHHCCAKAVVGQENGFTSDIQRSKITKAGLRAVQFISQVDRKFLVVKIPSMDQSDGLERNLDSGRDSLLVLVDQHAADERCRVEALLQDYLTIDMAAEERTGWRAKSESLDQPLRFELSTREQTILRQHQSDFGYWGVVYDVVPAPTTRDHHTAQSTKLVVKRLPTSISERCQAEPRLLINLIRQQAWSWAEKAPAPRDAYKALESSPCDEQNSYTWLSRLDGCPQGILDMINSRACRSAIMFNDILSPEHCKDLLMRLADCAFPFQCAHGRPSMVPLLTLSKSTTLAMTDVAEASTEPSFMQKFREWQSSTS